LSKKYLAGALFISALILALAGWVLAQSQNHPPGQPRKLEIDTYELKSPLIIFTIGVQEKRLYHRAVSNRIIHKTNYLEGEEFILYFPAKTVRASEFLVDKIETYPNLLSFHLSLPLSSLSARLDFQISESGAVIEKKLLLRTGRDKKLLEKICLIDYKVGIKGVAVTFPSPGQPVYKGNLFFAIADPFSEALNSEQNISICYQPGKWITPESYQSYPALIGVSEPDRTGEWFFKYLDEKRHRGPAPYLLYNSWYDLPGTVNEAGVLHSIRGIKTNLTDPYGIKLDAVVIDDGWDNFARLWEFHPEKFPAGIAPIRQSAETIGAHPGMWFSPAGGYGSRKYERLFGTLGQGYEKNWLSANIIANGYCPAGEKYHRDFQSRITDAAKAGVSYFKLDNIGTTCFVPWHSHPVGKASKTAVTDALISVMTSAHEINPDAFFNITVGAWLSPFWLLWADCVWLGGMDYGFQGPGSAREKSITYRDQNIYHYLKEPNLQFPFNGLMTHGIIRANANFKDPGPLGEFERDFIMYLGRGVSMWELYISPDLLSPEEWAVLAKWIKWAQDNWEILKNTQMVLGDPNQLEIYGYWHQGNGQALLILRNPSDRLQTVSINPSQLGLKSTGSALQEYPDADTFIIQNSEFRIQMKPFEVKLLRF